MLRDNSRALRERNFAFPKDFLVDNDVNLVIMKCDFMW